MPTSILASHNGFIKSNKTKTFSHNGFIKLNQIKTLLLQQQHFTV